MHHPNFREEQYQNKDYTHTSELKILHMKPIKDREEQKEISKTERRRRRNIKIGISRQEKKKERLLN